MSGETCDENRKPCQQLLVAEISWHLLYDRNPKVAKYIGAFEELKLAEDPEYLPITVRYVN